MTRYVFLETQRWHMESDICAHCRHSGIPSSRKSPGFPALAADVEVFDTLPVRVLLIDNTDSFTWNLAQQIGSLGADCRVLRADRTSLKDIASLKPSSIVISPGPHRPEDAPLSMEIIKAWAGRVPLLGVCLGHQCIAAAFGGRGSVTHAKKPMHGKTSDVFHTGDALFRGVPSPFPAARYHSLVVSEVPDGFTPLAWTGSQRQPDELMAMKHQHCFLYGIQFHPESFLTPDGKTIVKNFLSLR